MPEGAHAGQLTLHPCTLRDREGQLRRRLRHARRAREPRRPALASDRPAGHAHPRPLGAPGDADLPARGRPRHHEHGRSRRRAGSPATHDVVLVGYRGVDGSVRLDCPEVDLGAGALARLPQREVDTAPTRRRSGPAPSGFAADGVDLAGYTLPERVDDLEAARRRSATTGSTCVSESAGTRTAMIYAWRYPESIHRSVMIGVNPPGALPLGRADDRRADRAATPRSARRTRAAAAGRPTSPRRCRRTSARHLPITGCSCRSSRATSRRRRVLRSDGDDLGGGAARRRR